MIQSLPSPDGFLLTVVLATLAIGLPIFFVMSIFFLSDRNVKLGRSRELERLIRQLDRIASAMEKLVKLPSAAAEAATHKPREVTPLTPPTTQPGAATQVAATPAATAESSTSATHLAPAEQPGAPQAAAQEDSVSQTAPKDSSAQGGRQGGVNSMFGL